MVQDVLYWLWLAEKCGVASRYFDRLIYFCNNGFGNTPNSGEVFAREYTEPAIYPQKRIDKITVF
jgi:hypothetical protein